MKRTKQLYYGDYLQLDKILDAQQRESFSHGRPAHDEMLFIVTHQAYELWFKQVLFELDSIRRIFMQESVDDWQLGKIVHRLHRIVRIQNVINQHLDILETMQPLDFLEFRDLLFPASGFQSVQFRLIEARLGLSFDDRLEFDDKPVDARLSKTDQQKLADEEAQPSLLALIEQWLERTPFINTDGFDFWQSYRNAVENMLVSEEEVVKCHPDLSESEKQGDLSAIERTRSKFEQLFNTKDTHAKGWRLSRKALQAALFITLYRDEPALQLPSRLLGHLMDIDENFAIWRQRHRLMVMRMMGAKVGTGGSSGADYLSKSAEAHWIFKDFFALSTYLIARENLPQLPDEVRSKLGFGYAAAPAA